MLTCPFKGLQLIVNACSPRLLPVANQCAITRCVNSCIAQAPGIVCGGAGAGPQPLLFVVWKLRQLDPVQTSEGSLLC